MLGSPPEVGTASMDLMGELFRIALQATNQADSTVCAHKSVVVHPCRACATCGCPDYATQSPS